jgi:hypothetical protein
VSGRLENPGIKPNKDEDPDKYTVHFGFRHSNIRGGTDVDVNQQRIKMMEPGCHSGITLDCSYFSHPNSYEKPAHDFRGDLLDVDKNGWPGPDEPGCKKP